MYSLRRVPNDLKEISDDATMDACYKLGCCLPEISFVTRDDAGGIRGPDHCHGWHDDRGIFILIEGRQPHEIVRTVYHECSHHCDSLRYGGDLGAALADKEASEQRAQHFANEQTQGLPVAVSFLLKALEGRLHAQRYPESHALAMVIARQELASRELERLEFDIEELN